MRPRAVAACLAALAACLAGGPPALGAVDAGPLRARAGAEPWRVSFFDRAGRVVLATAGGPATGPGALGFRSAAGWFRATRVERASRPGRAFAAVLATDDPGGRRLAVRLAPDASGVIGLHATVIGGPADAVGVTFGARPDERYLGFGERSNAVDQRGGDVEDYVEEGAYEPDDRPIIKAVEPPWAFRPRDDATYFPIPWLLSTAGYGVLVDGSRESTFRLGERRTWSVEVQGAELRLRVFAGPRPADALRRLTARIGRQPRVAAPFFLGPWYQPTGDDEEAVLRRLRAADAPVSVAQTYTHYLPCASHLARRAAERERVSRFHAAGLAVTTYFNPMICTTHPAFGEAAARGALTKNPVGQPYRYAYSTLTRFEVGQFDFSASAGRELYARLLGEAIADGHDGWMEDFGEYTPPDSRSANGMTGAEMHNLYPVQYRCAAQAGVRGAGRPLARFARSGWTGAARCAPIVWGGDPTVGWGFDGLSSAITNGLTMGLSGVSTWGSDIGGFFALLDNELTPELLVRWIELGAVSGVMRTEAEGIAIPSRPRPQIWDPGILPHWRRWAKLRTQLYPYLAAADAAYRRSGLPIMRHLALAYPSDPQAVRTDDEYLFGTDLLAAPVTAPGARTRSVYLPPGRWVDLWRSARYRARDGGLSLGRARALRGGRRATVPAPLDELPLLARAGTLLSLLTPDVDTLAAYGETAPVVSLGERARRRVLLAFPRGRSRAPLEDGGRLTSRERGGRWELAVRSRTRRRWELQASLLLLRRPLRPCAVELAGRRLPRSAWSYDADTGVLSATFDAAFARLTVGGGRCRP